MILIDTSAMLAALDGDDPMHGPCADAVRLAAPPLLLSPFVVTELDYLLGKRVGRAVQRAFLGQVALGAYRLEPFDTQDVRRAAAVIDRYEDLDIGLADASLVVIAERHGLHDLLTLDERHFRALLGPGDLPFRLLPADAG